MGRLSSPRATAPPSRRLLPSSSILPPSSVTVAFRPPTRSAASTASSRRRTPNLHDTCGQLISLSFFINVQRQCEKLLHFMYQRSAGRALYLLTSLSLLEFVF